ncbi:MAG: hypothetical protein SPJ13_07380 [Bacteroidales bacterium]|nr:hypothetical protein [Bacteroidales bacterium]
MNIALRNIMRFALLMLLQTVVLNNVYLGGFITPMLFVLFILMLPTGISRTWMLVIGFATGLAMDLLSNAPGFHACACTAMALCRFWFGDKMLTHGEDTVVETPSLRSLDFRTIAIYLFVMLLIYHLLYFHLVIFSLRDAGRIWLSAILSTTVTWVLAIVYQSFIPRKK